METGCCIHGQWKIHESDFLKIEVAVPSLGEQRKIGSYLNNLDNLITLHQRKCDQTKELKKFMLQKMFPKKKVKKIEKFVFQDLLTIGNSVSYQNRCQMLGMEHTIRHRI